MQPVTLLFSCEHGGNRLPARYRRLIDATLLESHRGYDPGALELARELAGAFGAPLLYSTTSRLLVELNRSLGHRQLFSPPVRLLPRAEREALLERFYFPYWNRLAARVAAQVRRGRRVVHLSCHSFTPVLDGVPRSADVGLLFDPAREAEAALCAGWQQRLREADGGLRVRRNYPYRGTQDCLVAALRRRFDARDYVGIELEVNQSYPLAEPGAWRALRRDLATTLAAQLARFGEARRSAVALPLARHGGRNPEFQAAGT